MPSPIDPSRHLSVSDRTLCEECDLMLGESSNLYEQRERSLQALEETQKHCHLCACIYWKIIERAASTLDCGRAAVKEHWPAFTFQFVGTVHTLRLLISARTRETHNGHPDAEEHAPLTSLLFKPVTSVESSDGDFYIGPLDSATKSGTAWSVATEWMRNCTEHHLSCNGPPIPADWRPTRLVDLEPQDEEDYDHQNLCLREGDEIPPAVRYVTLSHCWGGSTPLQLTTENRQSLKTNIPHSSLPQTFVDAIEIAKRLGVQYIWIDSLCIIQDSSADWQHEASAMGSVYGNSFCNIAATGASSPSAGAFIPCHNPHLDNVLRVRLNWNMRGWFAGEDWYSFDLHGLWHDRFPSAPLNRRAWVVQERLLAPRVLHFGLPQLVWECGERMLSERFPKRWIEDAALPEPRFKVLKAIESRRRQQRQQQRPLSGRQRPPGLRGAEEALLLRQGWNEFVAAYSGARLTRDTDRMIAMSGIVAAYSSSSPLFNPPSQSPSPSHPSFLAGLWAGPLLPRQLLWRTNTTTATRHAASVAPTWSWASVRHAPVTPDPAFAADPAASKDLRLVDVLSAQARTTGPADAWMRVRGSLARAALERRSSSSSSSSDGRVLLVRTGAAAGRPWARIDAVVCEDAVEGASGVGDVWLLPVVDAAPPLPLGGLVLERVAGGRQAFFRRRGAFWIGIESAETGYMSTEALENFWLACGRFDRDVAEASGAEVGEERDHAEAFEGVEREVCDAVWRYMLYDGVPSGEGSSGGGNKVFGTGYKRFDRVPQYTITIK